MSTTSVSDLKHSLRSLIASSSMEAVYTSLTQIMKDDYEFLQKFYTAPAAPAAAVAAVAAVSAAPTAAATTLVKKTVAKKSTPVAAAPPAAASSLASATAPSAQQDEQEAPRIRADTKVRVVKKPTDPQDLPTAAATVVQPAQQEAQPFVHAESGLRNPQEQKKWQKEQEDKKMQDLRATGVNPASLLTEANLRKWVEDEKKTFAFIAREYVGLSDGVVAAEAKKYGLQSDTSKRRAMIAANKARG